jgi:hypothetical protein
MGRRPDLSVEMVEAAQEVARKTRDVGELRRGHVSGLSGVMGLTLLHAGELIGRSRTTGARLHARIQGLAAWAATQREEPVLNPVEDIWKEIRENGSQTRPSRAWMQSKVSSSMLSNHWNNSRKRYQAQRIRLD